MRFKNNKWVLGIKTMVYNIIYIQPNHFLKVWYPFCASHIIELKSLRDFYRFVKHIIELKIINNY